MIIIKDYKCTDKDCNHIEKNVVISTKEPEKKHTCPMCNKESKSIPAWNGSYKVNGDNSASTARHS